MIMRNTNPDACQLESFPPTKSYTRVCAGSMGATFSVGNCCHYIAIFFDPGRYRRVAAEAARHSRLINGVLLSIVRAQSGAVQ